LYHNGIKIGSGNSWQKTYSYNIKLSPNENLLALEGVNAGKIAGFIGTFGNEDTSASKWKCENFNKTVPDGWNTLNFNDTAWHTAVSYGKNNNLNVWKQRPSISNNAEWLWTNDNKKHKKIYCRYKLTNKQNIQLNNVKKEEKNLEKSNIDSLINYHNESNVKLRELEKKISKILHETQVKYEEEIKINKNNIKPFEI
jgi:hypothetical protein